MFKDIAFEYLEAKKELKAIKDVACLVKVINQTIGSFPWPLPENSAGLLLFELKKKHYAQSTLNKFIKTLRQIVNWKNSISVEQCHIRWPKCPAGKGRLRFLEEEEQKRLLSLVDKTPDLKVFTYILLYTGARLNEALNLTKDDYDSQHNTIRINRTKTNTVTTMGVSPELRPVLTNYLKGCEKELFDDKAKRRLTDNLRKILSNGFNDPQTVKEKGRAVIHTLRHTFATNALSRGVEIPVLCTAMGHTNIQETMNYAHIVGNKELQKKLINNFW